MGMERPKYQWTPYSIYTRIWLTLWVTTAVVSVTGPSWGVGAVGYVEQYLNSPEVCPPVSSGSLSHILKRKIRLANFPNNTVSVKLSRWQERNPPSAHLNFRCTFEVTAPKGYGVMATIRSLHLRRYSGRGSRGCRDFLRFRQEDSKISTDVCGEVESSDHSGYPDDLLGPRHYYDHKAGLDVSILTEDTDTSTESQKPLSIELIFTAYTQCNAYDLSQGKVRECSDGDHYSCIPSSLFCDGVPNCGLSGFGNDERDCEEASGTGSRGLSIFIFAITAIGTLVMAALCILIICCCCRGCKGSTPPPPALTQQSAASGPGLNLNSSGPTAPLPDLTEMPEWRSGTPTAPKAEAEDDDLPPSYKDLFPHPHSINILR